MPRELDRDRYLNRAPERFTPAEWRSVHGSWAAFEIYTPESTPLRTVQALGASAEECARILAGRGLDAGRYEFLPLLSPLPL